MSAKRIDPARVAPTTVARLFSRLGRRSVGALAVMSVVIVFQSPGRAQSGSVVTDPLPFTLSYTVTGNLAVAGVDFLPQPDAADGDPGFQTETIHVGTAATRLVPANAELIAAWLYWETLVNNPADLKADFRGLSVSHLRIESQTLTGVYAPCWSQSGNSLYMMRADVLMFFPPQRDEAGNPTGRRLVNDMDLIAAGEPLTTVRLPERGTGNQTPQSAGATIMMVYRDPAEPLRKIVVYDGLHVQAPGETTKQRLRGFLQSSVSVSARQAVITQIIARGAANPSDVLTVTGAGASTVAGNEFQGSLSPNSDRGWANPTTIVTSSLPGTLVDDIATSTIDEREFGEQLTTSVRYTDQSTYGCHTWAAMALSTTVQDADRDGLTDVLETPPTNVSVFRDPNGNEYPKLWTMGAAPNQNDMFIEVNSMKAGAGTTYGSGVHKFPLASQDPDGDGIVVDAAGHDHKPTPKTLTMVGDALFRAGVRAHFDVGPLEAGGTGYSVNSVFYPFPPQTPGHPSPASYFIDGAGATGGESILETPCVLGTDPLCQFPAFPGTVSWKFELQQIRDEVVDANGTRRFDPNRHLIFHYLFFAHARGYAKSAFPCLNGTQEVGYPTNPTTAEIQPCSGGGFLDNASFHVPLGLSGVSDLPGFNSMVALGLSKNFVGTEFFQASTTLHELGHSVELWHGGTPPIFTASTTKPGRVNVYVEPNCKPNYQSSMSYLHQLYGLIDVLGVENIDYSNTRLGTFGDAIDETALSDVPLQGVPTGPRYRTAWYAPLAPGTTGAILNVPAAKTHCDGTAKDPSEPPMGRLQSDELTPLIIDWAGDGAPTSAQDVNLDGHTDGLTPSAGGSERPLRGVNDLQQDHIRLNQLGGGQNAGGFSVGIVYVGTEATVDAVPYPNGGDYGDVEQMGTFGLGFGTGGVKYVGDGNKYLGGLAIGTGGIPYITGGLPIGTGGLPIMTGGLGIGTGGLGFATGGFPLVDGVAAVSGLAIGTGGIPIATGGLAIGTGGLAIGTGGLGFGTGGLGFGTGGLYLTQIGGAEIGHNEIEKLGHAPPNRLTACILGIGTCPDGPPLHRHLLQWTASNLDSPEGFLAFRAMGNAVTGSSVVKSLTATALAATATSFVDGEELPDKIDFVYWTKALFQREQTGPSIFGKVKAINEKPTAVADVYTVASGVPVLQGNLFANDTDADGVFTNGVLDKSKWTAVLVNATGAAASAPAGLTFNGNGTFSYDTSRGAVTFFYKIDPGKWTDGLTDISPDSAVVSVTITVPDGTAPTVTALVVTPPTIWSPNGKAVTVTITGTATDTGGAGVASIVLDIEDEYNSGENRVNNPHDIDSETPVTRDGSFSVKLSLVASRLGSDKDGRKYIIYVGAKDRSGNIGWATNTLTVTAHDQSK